MKFGRLLSSRESEGKLIIERTIELLSFFESCLEAVENRTPIDKLLVMSAVDAADDVITETSDEDVIYILLAALKRIDDAGLI